MDVPIELRQFEQAINLQIQQAVAAAMQSVPTPNVNVAAAALSVNAVGVKLPEFWTSDPVMWFRQAEACFRRSKHPDLGDRRPSMMMNEMLALLPAGARTDDTLFLALFLLRLPVSMRDHLAAARRRRTWLGTLMCFGMPGPAIAPLPPSLPH
jgi:hypothetical protein